MSTLALIVLTSAVISGIALAGGAALLFSSRSFRRLLLPLVAFAAGTLLGGALLHMLPEALDQFGAHTIVFVWVIAGFVVFFFVEQFLQWHHCQVGDESPGKPLRYLVLLGDGLHNFLDGMTVAAAFVTDTRLGITASIAVAAHELPQELGDFGVLVHSGWTPRKALAYNFLSGITFLLGGLLVYFAANVLDVRFLLPFAAGNFLYIAASDLVPEVRAPSTLHDNLVHSAAFATGIALMGALRAMLE